MTQAPSRLRSSLLFIFLTFGFAAVAVRAFQFQIRPDARLKKLAKEKDRLNQQQQSDDEITSRGAIVDRNGRDLALSILTKSFFANPKVIKDVEGTAARLSPLLRLPISKVRALLKQDRYFVWLKREVDESTAKKIDALHLEGVFSRKESKRIYPNGDTARAVIGISGRDGVGLEGIEKTYDQYLRTSDKGSNNGIRDALGRLLLFDDFEREWFETAHVVSTIDIRLQRIVEDELRATLQEKDADLAEAVMMNPKTGEILAMASIDGRKLLNTPGNPSIRNRAISDVYEPGSTFKIVLAASAIENLKYTANSQIYGENGQLRVGNHIVREYHNHKYGWLTLQELLEVSSNVAAAKVGLKLGPSSLSDTIHKFGFGQTTGVDLPGEAVGLVRSASSWRPIELANISFGQGIAVTPLQIVRAVSAVANGGYLIQPHIVSAVVSPKTDNSEPETIWQPELKREEVMSPDQARALTDMLTHVTIPGSTGAAAAVEGYKVAGKTGTSEKLVETKTPKGRVIKTYTLDQSIVSFVGFLPAYDPAFVLLIVYDNPKGRSSGGATAAPSFRRIASRAAAILGIPPETSSPALASLSESSRTAIAKPTTTASSSGNSHFVGKTFQEVLREIKELSPEERARYDLIGYGIAVKEEVDDDQHTKVYFK